MNSKLHKSPVRHTFNDRFHHFSHRTSTVVGHPWSFGLGILVIVVWIVTGLLVGFSDTWQLVVSSGTTFFMFLMVFLIQNTQNRNAKALHLKLDELMRSIGGARNELIDLQKLPEQELVKLEKEFETLRETASAPTPAPPINLSSSDT